jgi:hypothetical protein
VILRIIAKVGVPDHDPGEARHAQDDEAHAPADLVDQEGDDRRGHRVAEAREGVGDSLREAALARRRPVGNAAEEIAANPCVISGWLSRAAPDLRRAS